MSFNRVLFEKKQLALIFLAALLCIAFSPLNVYSQVIYVNLNATGENVGSSWADAFVDLQSALQNSTAGDEIWVARGIYYPTTNSSDRDSRFIIPVGVRVYGGFSGFENQREERSWNVFITTLSGDINRTGNLFGNSYTVLDISDTDHSTVVDGFTITGGNSEVLTVDGYPLNNTGGGIYNRSGNARISNCIVTGNQANQGAGMANLYGARPQLVNVIFRNNLVVIPGGGGGMLNAEGSGPVIRSCLFENNESKTTGGGILNIYNSSPEIRNSRFIGNRALSGAAIFCFDNINATIVNTEFRGNAASVNGGVLASVLNNQIVLENCLMSGNSGANGGAVYSEGGTIMLINCTLAGNKAMEGGAVYAYDNSRIEIANSIIWNNRTFEGGGPVYGAIFNNDIPSKISFSYSIIQGSYAPDAWNYHIGEDLGGNRSYDPVFMGPAFNVPAPFQGGNYRLTECSPAVNFGSNALVGSLSSTDLQGNQRIIDGRVDMGAYEFEEDVPPPVISCEDIVVELNFRSYRSFEVNGFFVVIDSCGPVNGTIFGLDSVILDCSNVGLNTFTVVATDLFTELSDTCEITVQVENPDYLFSVNGTTLIPGDVFPICPGVPLFLGVDSIVFPATPLTVEFEIDSVGSTINFLLSDSELYNFSFEGEGVYKLTFKSILDANGCLTEGEAALEYYYFFEVISQEDVIYLTEQICRESKFRGVKIESDTVLNFSHTNSRGCDSLEVIEIRVFDSPVLAILGDTLICYRETAELEVNSDFEQFEWSVYPHNSNSVIIAESGTVSVRVTDEFDCIFDDEISVEFLEEISLDFEVRNATCEQSYDGGIDILGISGGLPPFEININREEIAILSDLSNLSPGNYKLEIVDQNGCFEETQIDINVNLHPFVEILGPGRIDKGDSVVLEFVTNLGSESGTIWDVPGFSLFYDKEKLEFMPERDVEVFLSIVDSMGCIGTAAYYLEVYEPITVFIPNAFSPNRDGINDRFYAFTQGDHIFADFQVFDRWGSLVFQQSKIPSNSAEFGWDGKFRGRELPQGEYLYVVSVEDDGQLKAYSGTVLLMR